MPHRSRTVKKVKKVTKKKTKYEHVSSFGHCRHEERRRHYKNSRHVSVSSSSSSSTASRSYSASVSYEKPKKKSKKHHRKHRSRKSRSLTADLIREYEKDAELFQPLTNFVNNRKKLAVEIFQSVDSNFVFGLFPNLEGLSRKESIRFIYDILKYMSCERIIAILNGEEVSTSSATTPNIDEEYELFSTITDKHHKDRKMKHKRKRQKSLHNSENVDIILPEIDDSECIYVTHERIEGEITTYGIVDVNGNAFPVKKRRTCQEVEHVTKDEEDKKAKDEQIQSNNDDVEELVEIVKREEEDLEDGELASDVESKSCSSVANSKSLQEVENVSDDDDCLIGNF